MHLGFKNETKKLIEERNKLKEESTKSNDPEVLKKYKTLRNQIKSRIKIMRKMSITKASSRNTIKIVERLGRLLTNFLVKLKIYLRSRSILTEEE